MRFTSTVLASIAVMMVAPALAQVPAQAPTPAPEAQPAAAEPAAAPVKKVVKRKGPPASIAVVNASAHTATQVVITGEEVQTPGAEGQGRREAAEAERLPGFGHRDLRGRGSG